MFIRVYRGKEDKEILLNLDHVWKIEVEYVVPAKPLAFLTSVGEGMKNPDTVRIYTVFAGNEVIRLAAQPDSPVTAAIEKIYKDSIKGADRKNEGQA